MREKQSIKPDPKGKKLKNRKKAHMCNRTGSGLQSEGFNPSKSNTHSSKARSIGSTKPEERAPKLGFEGDGAGERIYKGRI